MRLKRPPTRALNRSDAVRHRVYRRSNSEQIADSNQLEGATRLQLPAEVRSSIVVGPLVLASPYRAQRSPVQLGREIPKSPATDAGESRQAAERAMPTSCRCALDSVRPLADLKRSRPTVPVGSLGAANIGRPQ